MKNKKKIIFFCASGKIGAGEFGVGHLRRCRTLLDESKAKNFEGTLVCLAEKKELLAKNEKYLSFHKKILGTELKNLIHSSDDLVIDCSGKYFVDSFEEIDQIVKYASEVNCNVHLIDAYGSESIASHLINCHLIKNIFIPYIIPKGVVCPKNFFSGKDFILVDKNYAKVNNKVSGRVSKILITCGGSDPTEISMKILDVFESIPDQLDIDIVIGPNFSKKLMHKIENKLVELKRNISTIHSIENLYDVVGNYDLILCTSGITKYEIASAGIPLIVLPFDDNQIKQNKHLSSIFKIIDPRDREKLLNGLNELIYNMSELKRYSQNLRETFKSNGVSNFFNVLQENVFR